MAARGHRVTVVCHRPPGAPRRERRCGVDIIRLDCLHDRYVFTFVAAFWLVMNLRDVHVISTTTYNAAPPAWLAGKIRKIPVVLTVNETWLGKWTTFSSFSKIKAAIHERLERLIFALPFDRYIAISQATAHRLAETVPTVRGRLATIYYGFDATPWKQTTDRETPRRALGLENNFVVLGYGRPGTSKGFEWLIDAIPFVTESIPTSRFVLILSHPKQYAKELAALKQRAGGRVIFLDPLPFSELPSYVKAADCIVVPSLAEGFGYTTLEAVAAGTPVVATNVGSIPEVIGGRHRLVPPKDARALAAGIVGIASGRWSESAERTFGWDRCIDSYETLYRSFAGGFTSPKPPRKDP